MIPVQTLLFERNHVEMVLVMMEWSGFSDDNDLQRSMEVLKSKYHCELNDSYLMP